MRIKVCASHRDEEDWINKGIGKGKRKRAYLITEWKKKSIKDPVQWARDLIAHFNSTLPEERHRRFDFIKKIKRRKKCKKKK